MFGRGFISSVVNNVFLVSFCGGALRGLFPKRVPVPLCSASETGSDTTTQLDQSTHCGLCRLDVWLYMPPTQRYDRAIAVPAGMRRPSLGGPSTFSVPSFPTAIPSCLSDIPCLRCKTRSRLPCNLNRSAEVMRRPRAGK